MKRSKKIQASERDQITVLLASKTSLREISRQLGRAFSSIREEVRRNSRDGVYHAIKAEDLSRERNLVCRRTNPLKDPATYSHCIDKLRDGWSPEEIAKRLKTDYATDMTMQASYETIYTYLYCLPRGSLKKELLKCLRQERKYRHNRKAIHAKRGAIQDFLSISERPEEVKDRIIPGHWEGDLIMGSKRSNTAMGTLVERTTRYLLLVPLASHDAQTVRMEFTKAVKKIPRHLKKTLTYDRGTEMAQHKLFSQNTKIQVYFADPHSPWQRGTNENTNGLLRQYFPKGIDFRNISSQEIKRVQDQMNDRPRKALQYLKPDEAFKQLLINPNLR